MDTIRFCFEFTPLSADAKLLFEDLLRFNRRMPLAAVLLAVLAALSTTAQAQELAGNAGAPAATVCAGPEIRAGSNLYVAPGGSDTNSGEKTAPFATLAKARDTVRALRGKIPAGGVTVWLRGGDYWLNETFTLAREDSGAAGAWIIYRAFPGERPRLIGGTTVDPARWKSLSPAARKRIHPNINGDLLREFDVSQAGLKRVKAFAPRDRFSAEWFSIDLFANDQRQPISRWPNRTKSFGKGDPDFITCNGSKDNRTFYYGPGGQPVDGETANQVDADGTSRIRRWQAAMSEGHELWLRGFWRTPWEPFTLKVEEINPTGNWIRFRQQPPGGMGSKYTPAADQPPTYRVGSGKENWHALNLLEEIDQPGEWAIDIRDQKIYYHPPVPIETLRIMVSDRDTPIVHLENVAFVKLLGLQLEGGMGHGVDVTGGSDLWIAGCTLRNVDGSGIRVERSSRVTVQSNDLYEGGGWGIELRTLGDRATLVSSGVSILNNHIHDVGRLASKDAIYMEDCVDVTVAHNLLHDLPKAGIRTELVNNCTFEFNEIHNNALGESDTGAFYSYGGWTTYGNVFRYNFLHHLNRSNGFYSDDGTSGSIVYHNVVHEAINGLLFGGGHDLLGHNNLLVKTEQQSLDDRGIARNYRLGTPYEQRLRDMKPDQEPWRSYGVKLREMFKLKTDLWKDVLDPAKHPEYPNGSGMYDNVSVATGGFRVPKNGNVDVRDNVMMQTVAEAGFYNYALMDLRTNNARILEKIPDLNTFLPQSGLQKDAYRMVVPTRAETGGLANRGDKGDLHNEDQFIMPVR